MDNFKKFKNRTSPKRYFFSVVFILFAFCLFGQDEYLKNKIGNAKLKQIKNKSLVNSNILKQTKGKVTVIEFWETWCGPCIMAMRHLVEMKEKFPDELEIICVSCDDLDKTISFIEENKFPFTFIYDKEKYLKKQVFPHSGIPHSILVDKTGKIQAGTLPGFITEEVLKNLINDQQVDIPQKTLFNPENLTEEKSENTLINFELRSCKLGDRGYTHITRGARSKRLLMDYQGGYKDTIVNFIEYTVADKNILELYQCAYEDFPLTRFIYDKELDYINTDFPDKKYTMIFSCSDLFGNHQSILVNQLNSVFGLKTSTKEQEVEVLILEAINIEDDSQKPEDRSQSTVTVETSHLVRYKLNASYIRVPEAIVKSFEHFFQIPVETELPPTVMNRIEIDIERDSKEDVDTWIALFKEKGIILRKERKVLKFIEIEKST